ncbi:MAG: hypothetical protein GXO92_05845, partial [FCB group bacterium]|nr:hypothetical protein [FCB group bacterium]
MFAENAEEAAERARKFMSISGKLLAYTAVLGILVIPALVNAQWVEQTNGLPADWDAGYAIAASDTNTSVLAIHTAGGTQIYRTVDGGNLWTEILPPGESALNIKDIAIVDDQHIWFCTGYPGEI